MKRAGRLRAITYDLAIPACGKSTNTQGTWRALDAVSKPSERAGNRCVLLTDRCFCHTSILSEPDAFHSAPRQIQEAAFQLGLSDAATGHCQA